MVIREWMSVRRDKQIPHDQAAALAKAVAQRSRLLAGRRDPYRVVVGGRYRGPANLIRSGVGDSGALPGSRSSTISLDRDWGWLSAGSPKTCQGRLKPVSISGLVIRW
jgi:hypothetical protein